MPTPLVIAHRGNSSLTLENSLEAIRSALSLSVDMIEIDIRMSRDRGLYVMHDNMTTRTADRSLNIEKSLAEEINRVRLKNGEPIPSLGDVLDLVSGACGINLEIKSVGAGAVTARHLLSSGYKGHVLVSSFKEEEVAAARQVMPTLPAALIFDFFTMRNITAYRNLGYTTVSLRKKTVNEKLVAACHEQGLLVYVWTLDEESEMRKLISWGVDGIISNKPGVLKETIKKHQIPNDK